MAVLSFLLLAISGAVCTEQLRPAMDALRQNKPAQAAAILEPLRDTCSQSSSFHELLGLTNELTGHPDAAEAELTKAISMEPNSQRLLTELGVTYLRNRKAADAAKALNEAARLDPSNLTISKYRIAAYVQLSDWRRVSALFREMGAENNPAVLKDPMLTVWFARALIETNRAELLHRLLPPDQHAMPPPVLFSLGTLLAQHRYYQQAITYLQCIPEQSADEAVYFNLGLAYSHVQKIEKARQNYFKAIDRRPQHIEAYFHIGLDYASAGNPRFAIPWLMQAHTFAPKRPDITYALVEQLIALDYGDTAQEILNGAGQTSASNPLLLVADGDLKQRQGKTDTAIGLYQRALGIKADLAPALVAMARAEAAQGKLQDAEARLRQVTSADPSNIPALAQLGLLEARQERWDSAVQLLNRAWSEDRSNPEIALALARAYRRLGRPADALATLTSVKAGQQDSAVFHIELAQTFHQLHREPDARVERNVASRLETQSHSALHFENPKTYVY